MSGVSVGPRIDKLDALHRRATHDLAVARRRQEHDEAARLVQLLERLNEAIAIERPPPPPPPPRVEPVLVRLAELGVTAKQVKTWATQEGLIPAVVRGRVAGALVEAYAAAHPDEGRR